MKAWVVVVLGAALLVAGCGKKTEQEAENPRAAWASSPEKVVQGIMHAYQTRDDSLYASLLADDFRYYFEPAGADSADVLGWGKEEEVVATSNLFKTQDVVSLSYELQAGPAHPDPDHEGWMVVPVSGGEMDVVVRNKEPMKVTLNRQELIMRPLDDGKRWVIEEWHDYPAPDTGSGGGETPAEADH
jgi:hypothetical protein